MSDCLDLVPVSAAPGSPREAPRTAPGTRAVARVLVLSTGPRIAEQIAAHLPEMTVSGPPRGADWLAALRECSPAVTIVDLTLEGASECLEDRLASLQQVLLAAGSAKTIALVDQDRRDVASRAVGLGATDFYHLPFDSAILPIVVGRAVRVRELEIEQASLRASSPVSMTDSGIVGSSDALRQSYRTIEKVATTNATVLVLGESGTGKELIARALHRLSRRAQGPFCAINCAAIPEPLLESELFGHEKGAFTGAFKQTQGRLELAAGGTVFLDEIGEMAPALQAKLLRVTQERVVERVGGRTPIPLDIRIICATHRDLKKLIEAERFREDLYYRISEVTVSIPALRERGDDVTLLGRFFLRQCARRHGRAVRDFTPDAIHALQVYPWPGNVRELENRVNSAVIMADSGLITAADLGLPASTAADAGFNLRDARRRAEADTIRQALAAAGGNLTRAAGLLSVTRPTLYDLLERHGFSPAERHGDA